MRTHPNQQTITDLTCYWFSMCVNCTHCIHTVNRIYKTNYSRHSVPMLCSVFIQWRWLCSEMVLCLAIYVYCFTCTSRRNRAYSTRYACSVLIVVAVVVFSSFLSILAFFVTDHHSGIFHYKLIDDFNTKFSYALL